MSFYNMSVMGIVPLGNLFIGGLASITSTKSALIFRVLCCIIYPIIFDKNLSIIQKIMCQVYINKGIFME